MQSTIVNTIKAFFELKKSKRSRHIPFLASLCVGIPLFCGWYFGALAMGLQASLGGLVILYYQPNSSFRRRMVTMLVCSLGFVLSLVIGLGFSFKPYVSAIVLKKLELHLNLIT
jgi:uncharacterized membrane protein YccC